MIGGFAVDLWPVEYGVSGIRTFTVSQGRNCLGKEFGARYLCAAQSMKVLSLDSSWQLVREARNGSNRRHKMKSVRSLASVMRFCIGLCTLALGTATLLAAMPAEGGNAPSSGTTSSGNFWELDPSAWHVTIYPLFGFAPVFGAHVDVPFDLPNRPGGGTGSGTATGSLNGALFSGFEVEKSRWYATGNFLWAGLSADRTTPQVHLGLDVIYGQVMGGREVLPHLTLEGGVRRMALNIRASALGSAEVSRKPGLWDPLIGMTWRQPLGRKWLLTAHLDGGGFGVGSDVAYDAAARADWRFARHFGVTMGAAALHFQVTDTVQQRTLVIKQTMWGPIFGFGIYF